MNYQQTGFNLLTNRRPANLLKLMEIYERIIYSDIDIIWKSDPRPYFKGNFDFWAQLGGVIDGSPYLDGYMPYICTGFFALQRTKKKQKNDFQMDQRNESESNYQARSKCVSDSSF